MTNYDSNDLIVIRALLSAEIVSLKNQVVAAVECGAEQYGTTAQSGFAHAQSLTEKLRATESIHRRTNKILHESTDGRLGIIHG